VRVAALADVHGNAPALEAVLAEVEREAPDLIVFCGDLTWGPLPEVAARRNERSRADVGTR
jgi:Icc-related predicted phosphoesterase